MHQPIRLENFKKWSVTLLLQYLSRTLWEYIMSSKMMSKVENLWYPSSILSHHCKSQLSAENYTSGAKQSLDSSRGNEVLLCCIIMGPLVSPWTRRKTWVALETYNIFFFCCCALPAKTFISIFWPRPKYILLHLWNRNICRKMPAKLRIINWSTLWNKFRRLVCFISHKLLTWFLEAIK